MVIRPLPVISPAWKVQVKREGGGEKPGNDQGKGMASPLEGGDGVVRASDSRAGGAGLYSFKSRLKMLGAVELVSEEFEFGSGTASAGLG
ncbi:MAG: hypothetical protein LBU64_03485 [Planctomycetota bacterium]|jgi:hypothetical protein|nr:hypothetical protein [Planctomycetota bacterium]